MEEKNALVSMEGGPVSAFSGADNFELVQRMAKMLSASKLVPQQFQGNIADCVLGIEMANRMKAPVLSVLQNMYIVHGKPSWSSQYLIAQINSCGKFMVPLQFDYAGEGDTRSCVAWSKTNDGSLLKGPAVSMEMAKREGWLGKNGSKWQTMPELMLAYRAATFFARLYVPEITMGLLTHEEVIDIGPDNYRVKNAPNAPSMED